MNLVELLVWSSVVYGVAMIVTTFKLFAKLRDSFPCAAGPYVTRENMLGVLLRCTPCFATWVAMAFASLGYTPVVLHLQPWVPPLAVQLLTIFASGMAGAAVAWTWRVVLAHLGSQTL